MAEEKMPKINFEELCGGEFAERTRQAIHEVMKNIADPNTEWKPKRRVTVELVFQAGESRQVVSCNIIAKPKLAPRKSVNTEFLIDKSFNGEVIASEFRKQIPGQQVMKVDSETGEIIDGPKDKENKSHKLEIVK